MALVTAVFVFVAIVGLIVAVWGFAAMRRAIHERLQQGERLDVAGMQILRDDPRLGGRRSLLPGPFAESASLARLIAQSGQPVGANSIIAIAAGCAAAGALLGWLRSGSSLLALSCGALAAWLPIGFLVYKKQQRLNRFERQLPDALDMMTRATRAGYTLAASIQLVGDEMPEPVGDELRRVFEEIRLGGEPGEALSKLSRRVPLDDVRFLCAAIRIQRTAGGNLSEMLERLAEVIRERFKLLAHAHALSAQQRWAAICIGASPIVFGMFFHLLNPHYFDPLLTSPYGPKLLMSGLLLEAVGFVMIWRIAKIKT